MSSKKPVLNFAQALRRKPGGEHEDASSLTAPEIVLELDNQLTTLVNQSTTLDNQLTAVMPIAEALPQVNESTSQPVNQSEERFYPSRTRRTLKGIRFQSHKLEKFEEWHFKNRKRFPSFQDAVEYAMDWLTSQPVDQLTNQPVNQSTTLINNDLNNLIINDAKAQRALGKYSQLTGKPVTLSDHATYLEISGLPVEAIERGLEETKRRADRAGKQMNSFKYALNVIREEATKIIPPAAEPVAAFCDRCRDSSGMVMIEREGKPYATRCPHT